MARLSIILKVALQGNVKPKNFSLDYLVFDYEGNELPICPACYSANVIEENGELVLKIQTGKGIINDYTLESYYNDAYEDIGIEKGDITAELLSSTNSLVTLGCYSDVKFSRVKDIEFIDMDTGEWFAYEGNCEMCDIVVLGLA